MIDLLKHPVIDSHCHAFLPEKEKDSFEQYLTLADHPIPKEDMTNTFIYRKVVGELSRVLDFKGKHEEIINERNRIYQKDPVDYIKLLFDDANIEMLLVDTGYPAKEFSGYSIDLKDFSKIVPCEIKEIYRIDITIFNLLNDHVPFKTAVEQFHEQNKNAVKNGAVGLKSVIAYRTGLEIQRNNYEDTTKAYMKFLAEDKKKELTKELLSAKSKYIKKILDYFVFLGIEDSIELNVPFQIHVGIGDAPFIDLRLANPVLLYDLINDESTKKSKIVLTHGGYPWLEEAGFLVNSYPNVFLDLSETIPFISIGVKEKIFNIFEMTPTNKIMYGSDGYNIPELFWISSIIARKAISTVLNELVESEDIDEEWANTIAKQFLNGNTKRIYNL